MSMAEVIESIEREALREAQSREIGGRNGEPIDCSTLEDESVIVADNEADRQTLKDCFKGGEIMKISEMNISVRLYAILHKHGIESIVDMSNYTPDDIIRWKDIGRRTLEELLSTMKSNSVKFKGE